LLKALWANGPLDQTKRLADDTISGLVEMPTDKSKQLQVSIDYAPDDHLLEGLYFSVLMCVAGHEIAVGPDTQRYKKMPSYEIHKKLRPGKPESEQWFYPGRKDFVPYDLSRLGNIVDLETLRHVVETWAFDEHLPGDMLQWAGPFIGFCPSNVMAFMGDIDGAQIAWDESASGSRAHRANDYTSHGWCRVLTSGIQAVKSSGRSSAMRRRFST